MPTSSSVLSRHFHYHRHRWLHAREKSNRGKRYTVALGEPIMKLHLTASLSPISVGDEETEEDEGVEHTIGRVEAWA